MVVGLVVLGSLIVPLALFAFVRFANRRPRALHIESDHALMDVASMIALEAIRDAKRPYPPSDQPAPPDADDAAEVP